MSFPLIQQPAPLQQLADVIGGIRQRRQAEAQAAFERQNATMDEARRNKYLTLNQEEAASRQRHQAVLETQAEQRLNLDRAQLGATIQNMAAQRMAETLDRKQKLIGMILQNAPPDFTVSLARAQREAAGNKYLPGVSAVPTTLDQEYQTLPAQAVAQNLTGRQGSTVRDAVPLTRDGVTYTPPTLNYNASSGGGGGGGGGPVNERHDIGQALLENIVREARDLEGGDTAGDRAGDVPLGTDFVASLVQRFGGHGAGTRMADRVRNQGILGMGAMNQRQQRYQALREQFKHSMAVFYPRAAIALMDNLANSYFSSAGESPQSIQQKAGDRDYLIGVIRQVRAGQLPRSALDAAIAGRLSPDAQIEFANVAGESGSDVVVPSGAARAPGSATPAARRGAPPPVSLDPRFLRRRGP